MSAAIAILMKDPANAKTRLIPALDNDARESLALLLFDNTLAFFRKFHPQAPIAVVTGSDRISEVANRHGASVLFERKAAGINSAADMAAAWASAIGAETLLVIHADVATIVASEIEHLLEAARTHAVVIAESYDGGTNALLSSPPTAIPFAFGPRSAAAHEKAAQDAALSHVRLRLPWLCRDIDTPADLATAGLHGARVGGSLEFFAIPGIPEISAGDDLGQTIVAASERSGAGIRAGDIVIVAQKVVSKCEGRMVPVSTFDPSNRAKAIATEIGKDARKVEAILRESTDVLRSRRQEPDGLLITRHKHGWICANAGIDESNLGNDNPGMLLLLPEDPDVSASKIRQTLELHYGGPIGVLITDTFGRPWRQGLVNVAIGIAGVPAIVDWTDRTDAYGRGLKATLPALADELAGASGLLMQKDAGLPVVVARGLEWTVNDNASARDFLRPISQELFI
jgi:coenzyme F420-0:L-glutamate ligase/coenzyme F420-1:gamma-L-glutamate ligase